MHKSLATISLVEQLAAGVLRNVVFISGCPVLRWNPLLEKGNRYLGRQIAVSRTIPLTHLILIIMQFCELDTINILTL